MTVEYIWIQGENGATMMAKQPEPDPKGLFGDKGMTFKDALDIINPLQQLPIIGSIYRSITGDTISDGARLVGGGIYGLGVLGVIGAAVSSAVEQTTGSDPGGTAIAMIQGKSLGEQVQTAQVARDQRQLAYTNGGADPIDPTSLPAGAKMVDVASPSATPPRALAALPTDAVPPTTPAATPAAEAVAATAAPRGSVSMAPLPPLIGQAGGGGVGTPTGDAGLIPSVPAMPAGATGLTAGSHLPTAGSITPAAASMMASSVQANATPAQSAAAAAGVPLSATAAMASKPAVASAEQAAAGGTEMMPLRKTPTAFPVPPRTNNLTPRMPVPDTHMGVGTQPLALSSPQAFPVNTVKASQQTAAVPTATTAAPASTAATTTSAPTIGAPTAAAAMPVTNPLATLPPAQVPDAMMRALDKYDALMKSRRNNNGQVDQSL